MINDQLICISIISHLNAIDIKASAFEIKEIVFSWMPGHMQLNDIKASINPPGSNFYYVEKWKKITETMSKSFEKYVSQLYPDIEKSRMPNCNCMNHWNWFYVTELISMRCGGLVIMGCNEIKVYFVLVVLPFETVINRRCHACALVLEKLNHRPVSNAINPVQREHDDSSY